MGNLDALRDWGHAKDYVKMNWLMLQQDEPQDYVIATGQQYSVRDFIIWSAAELGVEIDFTGNGLNEVGVVKSVEKDKAPGVQVGQTVVKIDERYFRPTEVETLLGDPSKAKIDLGWDPEISAQTMCKEMVQEDLKKAKRHLLLSQHQMSYPLSIEE
jgi:GDPmannose 4,6-dehydratase